MPMPRAAGAVPEEVLGGIPRPIAMAIDITTAITAITGPTVGTATTDGITTGTATVTAGATVRTSPIARVTGTLTEVARAVAVARAAVNRLANKANVKSGLASSRRAVWPRNRLARGPIVRKVPQSLPTAVLTDPATGVMGATATDTTAIVTMATTAIVTTATTATVSTALGGTGVDRTEVDRAGGGNQRRWSGHPT
jgi:hypothetical protein